MREFTGLANEAIREVLAQKTPAVLRGLVGDWPAVLHARTSPHALFEYLRQFDRGALVDALMTAPEHKGRLAYDESMSGYNFHRNRVPLSTVAEQVLRYARFPHAPAVAAQSALLDDCLPGFCEANPLAVLPIQVRPRIWLGNAVTTPAHVDEWNNVGCVVAGRRRFTLFPPEQVGNLYVGPLDFAPTGAPMSLVSLAEPDFEKYPKFAAALKAAQSVELGPGDALYIPPLWWHHVESLEPVNALVNYWWHDVVGEGSAADSGFDALLHGLLAIANLPPATRSSWAAFFQHYVFGEREVVVGHIPAHRHGILGELSPQQRAQLKVHLATKLGRN